MSKTAHCLLLGLAALAAAEWGGDDYIHPSKMTEQYETGGNRATLEAVVPGYANEKLMANNRHHRVWAMDSSFFQAANCGQGTGVQYTDSQPICEDHHKMDHGLPAQKDAKLCKVFRMFADKPDWPTTGFCRTMPQTAPNQDMDAEDQGLSKPYIVRADMLNWFGHYQTALDSSQNWYDSENIGHLGLYYNAVDASNYDFVYVQPKNEVACIQPGYVLGGEVKYYTDDPNKSAMRCTLTSKQMARKWFGLKVELIDGVAIITMENALGAEEEVAHVQPHFRQAARGGVLVANGFTNTAFFRHFYLRHMVHSRHAWDTVTERCEADSRVSFVTNQHLCPSKRPHHTCNVLKLHAQTKSWPTAGFCSTLPEAQPPFKGPYQLRADMFAGKGKVGLFYNAKSPDSYDFLYVTINDKERCLQSGFVEDGVVKWYAKNVAEPWLLSQSACASAAQSYAWFELTLHLDGTETEPTMKAYLDGQLIATVNPHFPMRAAGGALVQNGAGDIAYAKNFELRRNLDSARHVAKECAHLKCSDAVSQDGKHHVRVTHSNKEWKGGKHRCTLAGPGQGTLGYGLAKVGTWRATEDSRRQCKCLCADSLGQFHKDLMQFQTDQEL